MWSRRHEQEMASKNSQAKINEEISFNQIKHVNLIVGYEPAKNS